MIQINLNNFSFKDSNKIIETFAIRNEAGIEQNKIEVVKNTLKENLDINLISKITGLSLEEINHIKNNE